MQLIDGQLVFSATDLVGFLACEHLTALEMAGTAGLVKRPLRPDPQLDLIQERGLQHERRYLAGLELDGRRVTRIEPDETIESRGERLRRAAADTEAAIRRGDDVIYQAVFFDGRWLGYTDFLLRVETPSALGVWSYEIADTKLARHTRASALIQSARTWSNWRAVDCRLARDAAVPVNRELEAEDPQPGPGAMEVDRPPGRVHEPLVFHVARHEPVAQPLELLGRARASTGMRAVRSGGGCRFQDGRVVRSRGGAVNLLAEQARQHRLRPRALAALFRGHASQRRFHVQPATDPGGLPATIARHLVAHRQPFYGTAATFARTIARSRSPGASLPTQRQEATSDPTPALATRTVPGPTATVGSPHVQPSCARRILCVFRGLRHSRLQLGRPLVRLPGSRFRDAVEQARFRRFVRRVRRLQGGPQPGLVDSGR
jgi:hypothetical protein